MSNEHDEIAKIVQMHAMPARRDELLDVLERGQEAIAELNIEGRDKAQAALLSLGWDYSIDSAEWAKQYKAKLKELAVNLAIVQEKFSLACLELANISAAIDPSGKAAEFLMTAWGDEYGNLGELTAKQVAEEANRLLRKQTVKLRSEELAMLEYLERRREPVTRWTLHDVVDPKHRVRNREAADFGILLLQRLGMITLKTSDLAINDLISLVPNEKVDL